MKLATFVLAIATSSLVLISPAAASQSDKKEGAVDFRLTPAILSGNPFYGVVDLRWNVRGFFTDTVEDAVLKAQMINQKAAEYSKLRAIARNGEVVSEAASEYQSGVYKFDRALRRLSKEAVLERQEELSTILKTAVLNIRFTDDILATSASSTEQASFIETKDTLIDATLRTVMALDALTTLTTAMVPAEATPVEVYEEIRTAEVASMLASAATGPSLRAELRTIQRLLLNRILSASARLNLESLIGTDAVRTETLRALSQSAEL